jgi:hypothetical protein
VLPRAAVLAATDEGRRRRMKALATGRRNRWGRPSNPRYAWGMDLESALAECAYACWRGVFWAPTPDPDGEYGDVAGDQVRSTDYGDGHLLVYDRDPPWRRCVLLVGAYDRWRVAGWRLAGAVQIPTYLRLPDDGREPRFEDPCWAIPQADLDTDLAALRRPVIPPA